ncbi:hypothetical protein ANN_13374 [Periplaneta americana]|uniref:Uncharacterized protein n=1 Tax=Periplaneta americana TaxID=6978 RepID=A0ABQ8TL15_PERAM|nr:hypothetical protein ANN_13374 [Periplaneta americana]
MADLCEGGNEPSVSLKGIFNVNGIGDSEMVFGEMKARIHHKLPDFRLTIGKTSEKLNQVINRSRNRTHIRMRLRQTRYCLSYAIGYFTVSIKLALCAEQNCQFSVHSSLALASSSSSLFKFTAHRTQVYRTHRLRVDAATVTDSLHVKLKSSVYVVVITEDVQNVHLLLEYRPHIDVSLTCEHDPKLQEYCVCPQNMPQFDSEGIPNQAPETNKPMILNGPTSRNREGSDQIDITTAWRSTASLRLSFHPEQKESYFGKLLNVHRPNRNDRDNMKIHTAVKFIPEPTLSEAEIAVEKQRKYKSLGIDYIPVE